jgi:hypothetical protein
MDLAIKDKTAEYEKQQRKNENQGQKVDLNDNKEEEEDEFEMDEDEREIMEKMKAARLSENLAKAHLEEKAKKKEKENLWYGEYTEIVEQEFLPYVTKAPFSVVHFTHKDFERCKIFDFHLAKIAPEHKECKFLKLDAEKTPFFVQKLAIKVLPTVCCFKDGVLIDKIVGFEELGGSDDFKTIDLVRK